MVIVTPQRIEMSSWKEVMKQQHDDLERMEAMDAALNTEPVLSEVDRILKKPASTFGLFSGRTGSSSSSSAAPSGTNRKSITSDFASLNLDDLNSAAANSTLDDGFDADPITARSGKTTARTAPNSPGRTAFGSSRRGPASPGGATPPASAPDTQARYAKAKVKQLEAALAESEQTRIKINEQMAETKRLLIAEREESKKLKNRVKLLEIENRKGGGRRGQPDGAGSAGEENQLDAVRQEIDQLRKDAATAERLAKAAEANARAKETQLNRTAEIVARQKKQLTDLEAHGSGSRETERTRADAAEARCKVLEKQRADLISGFKKQMKLIDNLKRQKVSPLLIILFADRFTNFSTSLPCPLHIPSIDAVHFRPRISSCTWRRPVCWPSQRRSSCACSIGRLRFC